MSTAGSCWSDARGYLITGTQSPEGQVKITQQPRTGMETMGEFLTVLAIREGSVEEVTFFRPGRIFGWRQEQSYGKEGTGCPLRRQLLLPASPAARGTRSGLSGTHSLSRTNSACLRALHTPAVSTGAPLGSTGPPVLSGSSGHSSPSEPRDSQNRSHWWIREPFGLLISQITPLRLSFYTGKRLPRRAHILRWNCWVEPP